MLWISTIYVTSGTYVLFKKLVKDKVNLNIFVLFLII